MISSPARLGEGTDTLCIGDLSWSQPVMHWGLSATETKQTTPHIPQQHRGSQLNMCKMLLLLKFCSMY